MIAHSFSHTPAIRRIPNLYDRVFPVRQGKVIEGFICDCDETPSVHPASGRAMNHRFDFEAQKDESAALVSLVKRG